MEAGQRTHLLDFFRHSEVSRDIRLLAAQGALAPRADEQLALLVLLAGDSDIDVAAAAERTIGMIPRASLAAFIRRSEVPADVRAFLAARGIEPDAAAAPAADAPPADAPLVEQLLLEELLNHRMLAGAVAEPIRDTVKDTVEVAVEDAVKDAVEGTAAADSPTENSATALQRIASLNVAQRISLAMRGSREERAILIRDPNKIVGVAVLSSPKMSDSEIEAIARMASISEELLRLIAHTRAWIKHYPIAVALTKNPKTPLAVSMNLLSRLNDRDLRMLSTDRNIPDVLRMTARRKTASDK